MYIYTTAGREGGECGSQLIEALEGKRWRGERPLFKALEEAFLRLVNSHRMNMRDADERLRMRVTGNISPGFFSLSVSAIADAGAIEPRGGRYRVGALT